MAQLRKLNSAQYGVDAPQGQMQQSFQQDTPPQMGEPPPSGADVILRDQGGTLGRSQEKPREREQSQLNDNVGDTQFAMDRPDAPTPMAGSSFNSAPIPFKPMSAAPNIALAKPRSGGLLGGAGGLTGGGLGVPFDPMNTSQSDPISTLIQLLLKNG